MTSSTLTEPAVLGRDGELCLVPALTSRLADGRGALVVLTGPAGIGKTYLARALVARLPASVTRAGGTPFGHIETPALWPWRQVARGLSRARPGGGASALVQALTARPAAGDLTDLAVVERVVDLLLDEAQRGPFVAVLDELHRCDDVTLAVLSALCAHLANAPILVIACARTGPQTPATFHALLTRLGQHDNVDVRMLAGLPDDAVAGLVGSTERSGTDRSGADTSRIVRIASGNPLLALELGRAEAPDIVRPGEGTTLGRLVAERVAAAETGHVLATLALLGRPATLELLGAACELAHREVHQVLVRAGDAGMVAIDESSGTAVFAHRIFADAVVEQLDGETTRRLHRRLAALVEPDPSTPGPQTVERARHLIAAGTLVDDGATARACLAAALHEESVAALDAADELVANGLDNVADDVLTRVLLLRTRGRCHGRAGRLDAARTNLQLAVEVARSHADPQVFAEAVIDLSTVDSHLVAVDAQRRRLIEEALAVAPPASATRAILLARLSESVYFFDIDRSRALALESVAVAGSCDDPYAEAVAQQAWVNVAMHLGALEEVEKVARSLPSQAAAGRANAVGVLLGPALARGDRCAVDRVIAQASRGGVPLPVVRGPGMLDVARLSIAIADGDGESVGRLVAALGAHPVTDIRAQALLLALVWALHSGQDLSAAVVESTRLGVPSPDLARVGALAVACQRVRGTRDPAALDVVRSLTYDREYLLNPRPDLTRDAVCLVAGLAGWLLRDEELCQSALTRFDGHHDHFIVLSTTVLLCPVGWLTARALLGLGRLEDALAANAPAQDASTRLQSPTWQAQCLLQRAFLLRRHDPSTARQCARASQVIAEQLGLP